MCVLILTMDISLNSLLSFVILLCLTRSSFPILFSNDKKTDSRIVFRLLPLIVDIDSIIDIYVQHVGSPVIHNVKSLSARHDLFHLFNTILVIDNFTLSIWSEHDHRAIAAAFVHRQNCTFRVSDFKIDIHAAARSVGERNITLDAIMLQRFTQHTLQIHTVLHFLCRNRCRIIHWTRGHNTSIVDNWSIISTSNGEKYLSR